MSIKKLFLILIIILSSTRSILSLALAGSNCGCASSSNDDGTSKTFFRPRSTIEDVSLFLALNNYAFFKKYYREDGQPNEPQLHISKGVFAQGSTNSKKLSTYFLPHNKRCVSVREDGSGDLGSLWFNVEAPVGELYSSTLTLRPERFILGGFVDVRYDFKCTPGAWFDIKFSIYEAWHKLRPFECLSTSTVTDTVIEGIVCGAPTVVDFLSTSTKITYGKIPKCKKTLTNFDDIEIKLGYNVCGRQCNNGGNFDIYASAIIPIAPQPTAKYMFEPLIGRGHAGLGVGLNGGYAFVSNNKDTLALMADLSYQYLFSATEKRSLDLINGDWSRYLLVVRSNDTTAPLEGINFFTRDLKVTPGSVVNFWTALHWQRCDWHVELGYNLWYRQSEKICLKDECKNLSSLDLGIYDLAGVQAGSPTSAHTATINQSITTPPSTGPDIVVSDSPNFVILTDADLDLKSASHPMVLTNKAYLSIAYDYIFWDRPLTFGLTGSYEVSHKRTALNQWGIVGTAIGEF